MSCKLQACKAHAVSMCGAELWQELLVKVLHLFTKVMYKLSLLFAPRTPPQKWH